MMYELNWCGIYMPIWLVCLILGGLLSVVLGKLIQLISRRWFLQDVETAVKPGDEVSIFPAIAGG